MDFSSFFSLSLSLALVLLLEVVRSSAINSRRCYLTFFSKTDLLFAGLISLSSRDLSVRSGRPFAFFPPSSFSVRFGLWKDDTS